MRDETVELGRARFFINIEEFEYLIRTFKQGNHMLGSAVFQVSPATEHAFCGLAGSQSSTSQSKLGSSLGKR